MSKRTRVRSRLIISLAVCAACVSSSAIAGGYIKSVVESHTAEGDVVTIKSNEPIAFNVKSLNSGYRWLIDMNGTSLGSSIPSSGSNGVIKSVLPVSAASGSKLYILLRHPDKIAAVGLGDKLILQFAHHVLNTPAIAVTSTGGSTSDKLDYDSGNVVNDITFNGQSGSGVLKFEVSGKQPALNVSRYSGGLSISVPHSHLSSAFNHQYAVTSFHTPVTEFENYQVGKEVHINMKVNGPFKYYVYQIGKYDKVIVRPAQSTSGVKDLQRMSMNFQNVGVRDAISIISQFTHKNIVMSNSVHGSLSIELHDVPWKEVFNVILQSQNLGYKKIGDVIWVAPEPVIAAEESSYLKNEEQNRHLEPLTTALIKLKYAKASEIADLLDNFNRGGNATGLDAGKRDALAGVLGLPESSIIGNNLLGKRGSVAVVARDNALLIRDTPSDIESIKKLIHKIDTPVPQILIEAKIVQVNTESASSLGVNWGGSYTSNGGGGIVNLSGTGASGAMPTQGTIAPNAPLPSLINLPAYAPAGSALTGLNPASLGFSLGTAAGNRILSLQIQALQAGNKAKIISSPKVLTEDNEKALIEQGTEIPYQMASSSGATAVSFKKAELMLSVTPHISPNGRITMKVVAENNQPDYAESSPSGVPISTQKVETKLLVKNGQTVVIGGIYTEDKSSYSSGVPVIQDIPLLGWLFKSRTHALSSSELLIFITPKIVGGAE